jgi:uncharacterized protein (DUF488 family)
MNPIYTIGHSNHPVTRFVDLLTAAEIGAVVDARSQPVSRWAPQYNMDALMSTLEALGIGYFFMGRQLGGRPKDAALLKNGKPDYARMAKSAPFQDGIAQLLKEGARQRVAVMCAERDPADCHRFLLIGRHLTAQGVPVRHILVNGGIETQSETEQRLLGVKRTEDLFG